MQCLPLGGFFATSTGRGTGRRPYARGIDWLPKLFELLLRKRVLQKPRLDPSVKVDISADQPEALGLTDVPLAITYPASTGRNFDEILRVIDSLQLTDSHKVATPANWKHGDDVIIVPSLSNDDAKKLFPNGWDEKSPICAS
jgi:hypothetical protein